LKRGRYPPNTPPQSGDEPDTIPDTIGLPKKQKEILQLIAKDPKVSVKTISEKLDVNYYTAKEQVNTLKKKVF